MSTIRTLTDLAVALLSRAKAVVRVAVTGTLDDYDAGASTVTAAPDVSDGAPPPSVYGVPVLMPGGSLRGLTFGLAPGDRGVLLIRHRSHDEVDAGTTALPVTPGASRQMSMADAVCLPGYVPPADGRPAAHYREDGAPVLYMDAGEALRIGVSTAALALARAVLVASELTALKNAINGATPVAGDGGAAFKAALLLALSAWPGSVGTDRVLVDS
jgi:hypothetical protein